MKKLNRHLVLGCSGLVLSAAAALFAVACSDDTAGPVTSTGDASTAEDGSLPGNDAMIADGGGGADAVTDTATDAPDASDGGVEAAVNCVNRLPGSFGSNVCNKCVGAKCCGVLDTCTGDQDCNGALTCNLACFSEADSGGCFRTCIASTDGGNKYLALQDCWLNNECGVPCFQ
jgi:hypothetical protein